jgi:glutaredoxin
MVMVLYTRRGCHLCEAAEDMVAAHALSAAVEILDVDADPLLQQRYGLRVPVLTADGTVVMEGRFDEPALARLLTAPASAPGDRAHR